MLKSGERGFTLIEVMLGMVLLTFGLLAVADVFPPGLALARYGRDQTTAAQLAQQKIEDYRSLSQPTLDSTLAASAGDYTTVASNYFDQNGAPTGTAGHFTRDVQIQYWTWSAGPGQFVVSATPYTAPSSGTTYVYHVSVATHWLARGQTAFVGTGSTRGCIVGGASAATGLGCIVVTTFIAP